MSEPSQSSPIQQQYFTVKQVSQLIGKAVDTLNNERSLRRGIPFIKIGGKVVYSLKDIEAYMQRNRIETT